MRQEPFHFSFSPFPSSLLLSLRVPSFLALAVPGLSTEGAASPQLCWKLPSALHGGLRIPP